MLNYYNHLAGLTLIGSSVALPLSHQVRLLPRHHHLLEKLFGKVVDLPWPLFYQRKNKVGWAEKMTFGGSIAFHCYKFQGQATMPSPVELISLKSSFRSWQLFTTGSAELRPSLSGRPGPLTHSYCRDDGPGSKKNKAPSWTCLLRSSSSDLGAVRKTKLNVWFAFNVPHRFFVENTSASGIQIPLYEGYTPHIPFFL